MSHSIYKWAVFGGLLLSCSSSNFSGSADKKAADPSPSRSDTKPNNQNNPNGGPNGNPASQNPNGSNGSNPLGSDGPKGSNGSNGPSGSNGPNSADGSKGDMAIGSGTGTGTSSGGSVLGQTASPAANIVTDNGVQITTVCQKASSSGTPWQMLRGQQVPFANEIDVHGDPSEYAGAVIPDEKDPGWQPRTQATIEFNDPSQLPDDSCHNMGDYTYFQTSIDIPGAIDSLMLQVGAVDDGVRATIYNSKYPSGFVPPGAYIQLNGKPIQVEFAPYVVPGHNRIVMTHIDDCPVTRALVGVQFLVGNQTIPTCAN